MTKSVAYPFLALQWLRRRPLQCFQTARNRML